MLRIVNEDGMGYSTKVLNAETGEDLSGTLAISYGATVTITDREVKATMEPCIIAGNIVAGHTDWLTKHPVSGEYLPLAALEFRDGTRVEFAEDGTPSVTTLMKPIPGCEPLAEVTVHLMPHGYSASTGADESGMAMGINAGPDLESVFDFIREQFAKHPAPDPSKAPILTAADPAA